MRLDELKWRPREKEHHFDVTEVERADGRYVVLECSPDRTSYFALWVQPEPLHPKGYVHSSVLPGHFIEVTNPLAAQAVLIELLQEVTCDSTS